jgi:hypothetical protein
MSQDPGSDLCNTKDHVNFTYYCSFAGTYCTVIEVGLIFRNRVIVEVGLTTWPF